MIGAKEILEDEARAEFWNDPEHDWPSQQELDDDARIEQ